MSFANGNYLVWYRMWHCLGKKRNCLDGFLLLQLVTIDSVELGGIGGGRLPVARLSGGDFFQHSVDLFESKTLGLGNKEVGIDEAAEAESTPEEEDAGTKVGLMATVQVFLLKRSRVSDDLEGEMVSLTAVLLGVTVSYKLIVSIKYVGIYYIRRSTIESVWWTCQSSLYTASTLTKFNARRQSYTCSTMNDELYSQTFTNYLIIDTCVFLHCGELIARILISIWLKKAKF